MSSDKSKMAWRIRNLFRRKGRFRNASFRHANLREQTEATWSELLWRKVFHREYLDDDVRSSVHERRLRWTVRIVGGVLLVWFLIESLLAWSIFEG